MVTTLEGHMGERFWFGVLTAKDGESSVVVYDRDNQPKDGRVRLYRLKNHAIFELDKEDARSRVRLLEPEERGLVGYAVTRYYAARRAAAGQAADIARAIDEVSQEEEEAAALEEEAVDLGPHRDPDATRCESCGQPYEGTEFCRACRGTGWLSMA